MVEPAAFEVGAAVEALRRVEFRSGKVVEIGDRGTVTKVPGCNALSPCQVKVGGAVFSAALGDFKALPHEPSTRSPELGVLLSPSKLKAIMLEGESELKAAEATAGMAPPHSNGTSDALEEITDPSKRVPARLVHYIDYVGRWSDGIGKRKVEGLRQELETISKRLGEEAASKHEEAAWLQTEVDRLYTVAEAHELRAKELQEELVGKADTTEKLRDDLRQRDATIERLTQNLRTRTDTLSNLQVEHQKSGAVLKQTKEDFMKFQRDTHKKSEEESVLRRQLERQCEEAKAAKKTTDDQMYFKLEELSRTEKAVQDLEAALRQGNLQFALAKNTWAHQVEAQERAMRDLREEVKTLRQTKVRSLRHEGTQTIQSQMGGGDDYIQGASRVRSETFRSMGAESTPLRQTTIDAVPFHASDNVTLTPPVDSALGYSRSATSKLKQQALERAIQELNCKLQQKDAQISTLQCETSDLKAQAGLSSLLEQEVAAMHAERSQEWRSSRAAVETEGTLQDLREKLRSSEENAASLKSHMTAALRETEQRVRCEDFAAINDLQVSRDATALDVITNVKEENGALKKRIEQLENVASALGDVFPHLASDSASRGLLAPFLQQFAVLGVKTPL